MNHVRNTIRKDKVIAIARNVPQQSIVQLGQALLDGGLHCVEVTFAHAAKDGLAETVSSIRALREAFGDAMAVGAGTVLTPEEVRMAAEAGARYIISPDMRADVIAETKRLGLLSIPGAMTPTEICQAYNEGADFVKLFPIANLGVAYLKAVRGPLAHIPMMAVGGVNPGNIGQFLAAGAVGAGCGGNLVSLELIRSGRFAAITETAKEYVRAVCEAERN